jgi:8-oxo-dGTP pyrophosphatase MutT (NUDIX family)
VKESGGSDKGKWNQPAGWLEVGEDLVMAAKREVEEETGYEFTPTHLLGVYSLVRADLTERLGTTPHALKFIFIGDVSEQPIKDFQSEVAEIKWFTPEEIDAMDLSVLRDIDIKKMVADYFAGIRYPLELVTHTVSTR